LDEESKNIMILHSIHCLRFDIAKLRSEDREVLKKFIKNVCKKIDEEEGREHND